MKFETEMLNMNSCSFALLTTKRAITRFLTRTKSRVETMMIMGHMYAISRMCQISRSYGIDWRTGGLSSRPICKLNCS